MKQTILFATHFVNAQIEKRFHSIMEAGEELGYDTFMLLNVKYPFSLPTNINREKNLRIQCMAAECVGL